MLNHLVTVVDLPHLLMPNTPEASASVPEPAQPELPRDGQRFICPVTRLETQVHGLIIEYDLAGCHAHHWWGCWSCAGLYWKPGMPAVGKAWHVVRIAVTPQPTPADRVAQLITEFVAMRDVAEAALADLPPDPDYHTHIDDLLTHCRQIVQDLREGEGARLSGLITVHP